MASYDTMIRQELNKLDQDLESDSKRQHQPSSLDRLQRCVILKYRCILIFFLMMVVLLQTGYMLVSVVSSGDNNIAHSIRTIVLEIFTTATVSNSTTPHANNSVTVS
jgi:hypothetical protein